jgi:hypothetical protein
MAGTPAPMEKAEEKRTEGPMDEAALERQVLERRQRREAAEESNGGEPRSTKDVLRAAARGEQVTEQEIPSALDYYLASEEQAEAEPAIEPKELKLNLGTKEKPEFVRWVVVPVEDTVITKFRRESQAGTRAQKRRGDAEVDEAVVARKIVERATIDPDPRELAKAMDTGPDPKDAIYRFFARKGKTGMITQISGEVLSISGWDDEDVQEVEAAQG